MVVFYRLFSFCFGLYALLLAAVVIFAVPGRIANKSTAMAMMAPLCANGSDI
jgi:hypothetical protein